MNQQLLQLDHPTMIRIGELAAQRVHRLAPDMTGTRPLMAATADAVLAHLQNRPYRPEFASRVRGLEQEAWQRQDRDSKPVRSQPSPADMPGQRKFEALADGKYAVPSLTGAQDLDFFLMESPEDGKWAGFTFVSRVLGGHDPIPVKDRQTKAKIFKAIRSHEPVAGPDGVTMVRGPEASMLEAARELGECQDCHRELTDELSRQRGVGPVCWENRDKR